MALPDMSYGGAPSAVGLLGQPRGYQPNATRAQAPSHVKVPISTLIALLLAEAPKPVAVRSRPMQRQNPAAMGQLGMQRPMPQHRMPTVGSLSSMFASRRQLGPYQNF